MAAPGNDNLQAVDGDDTYDGGTGVDIIFGGNRETDTVTYAGLNDALTVTLDEDAGIEGGSADGAAGAARQARRAGER